jgi:hypothetical protein
MAQGLVVLVAPATAATGRGRRNAEVAGAAAGGCQATRRQKKLSLHRAIQLGVAHLHPLGTLAVLGPSGWRAREKSERPSIARARVYSACV